MNSTAVLQQYDGTKHTKANPVLLLLLLLCPPLPPLAVAVDAVVPRDGSPQASRASKFARAHAGPVNSLCFTWDGRHLLTGGTDNRYTFFPFFFSS